MLRHFGSSHIQAIIRLFPELNMKVTHFHSIPCMTLLKIFIYLSHFVLFLQREERRQKEGYRRNEERGAEVGRAG